MSDCEELKQRWLTAANEMMGDAVSDVESEEDAKHLMELLVCHLVEMVGNQTGDTTKAYSKFAEIHAEMLSQWNERMEAETDKAG